MKLTTLTIASILVSALVGCAGDVADDGEPQDTDVEVKPVDQGTAPETITIKPKKVAKFKAGSELSAVVNK